MSLCCGAHVGGIVHETEFQGSGGSQDLLGTGGILNTGQLNYHAIGTLTLYQRLGHAQFVDAVSNNIDILINGIGSDLGQLGLSHGRTNVEATVIAVIIL